MRNSIPFGLCCLVMVYIWTASYSELMMHNANELWIISCRTLIFRDACSEVQTRSSKAIACFSQSVSDCRRSFSAEVPNVNQCHIQVLIAFYQSTYSMGLSIELDFHFSNLSFTASYGAPYLSSGALENVRCARIVSCVWILDLCWFRPVKSQFFQFRFKSPYW